MIVAPPPLLAVEVLSPSTRLIDLDLTRERFREAGCPSSWAFDRATTPFLAWDLDADGTRRPVADITGGTAWSASLPPVTVVPAALVG